MTTEFQDCISKTVGEEEILRKLLGNRDYCSCAQCNCMYFRDFKIRSLWLGTIFLIPKKAPGSCHSPLLETTKSKHRTRTPPAPLTAASKVKFM